jgi:hypothetical protein
MQKVSVGNRVEKIAAGQTGIKLLVVDIDGTIAGESNQISQPVKQAIFAGPSKGSPSSDRNW